MIPKINVGEIWLANLNPSRGTEPGKTRPVLILQAQELLDTGHPSTIIMPLTTKLIDDSYPLRIRIKAQQDLLQDSDILIDQIRAIDNKRLLSPPLTKLRAAQMQKIYKAASEVTGMESS